MMNFWKIAALGMPGLALAMPSCKQAQTEKRPNIVFILADDLGYGDVSALNNQSKIKTPNIDRIAANGITFTDAHSSSAVCTPTRYSLLTGIYNWRSTLKNGVLNGYSPALIPENQATVASMLRQQDYHTACIGKWHLGWDWAGIENGKEQVDFSSPIQNGPTTRGFDYFYGFSGSLDMPPYVYVENDRPTALPNRLTAGINTPVGEPGSTGAFWREGPTGSDFDFDDCLPNLTRRSVRYIKEQSSSGQPFFLYFPLPAPHTPILPVNEFKGISGLNPYADFVVMVDWVVGEIYQALEQSGQLDNTILVFTSDNGCSPWADFKTLANMGHNPNYIFRGHKADIFEGGHRIPCLVQWPAKVSPSVIIDQTICLNDFAATFAAISGYTLKTGEAIDSYSLLPIFSQPNLETPTREATVHHSINGSFAIRKGDWKLITVPGSGGWSYPRPGEEENGLPSVQLYKLSEDPGETTNLEDKFPGIVEDLNQLLEVIISGETAGR